MSIQFAQVDDAVLHGLVERLASACVTDRETAVATVETQEEHNKRHVRQWRTKKKLNVYSRLTDSEAIADLPFVSRDIEDSAKFADGMAQLAQSKPLEPDQMAWVHLLANKWRRMSGLPFTDQQHPIMNQPPPSSGDVKPPARPAGDLLTIVHLFENASQSGKEFPKAMFKLGDRTVEFRRNGKRSKQVGAVAITDGGKMGDNVWYGTIKVDGHLQLPNHGMDDEMRQFVDRFANEPVSVLSEQGIASNTCCLCQNQIDRDGSSSRGIHNLCARSHGIEVSVDTK